MSNLIQGKTIFYQGTQFWDNAWTTSQHVAYRLAPENRVIYVEPFLMAGSWLFKKNWFHRQQRELGIPQLREVKENLFVYRPGYMYAPRNLSWPMATAYNNIMYRNEIRTLWKKLDIKNPLVWSMFAQVQSVLELDAEYYIYDCIDEWAAFFQNERETAYVSRMDEALCRRADIVFVSSQPLMRNKSVYNSNIHLLYNGADVPHFRKSMAEETVVPDDIASVPGPIIGFIGMMDKVRLDTALIERIANDTPYHVVIVGGFMKGAEDIIPDSPKIHVLGMKSVDELPNYLKAIDVCLMPYRINEATNNIYPLKLHEYMSSGKPIISTPIAAVGEFSDLLYVANNHDEFLDCVHSAVDEDDELLRQKRIACAERHSWDNNVRNKLEILSAMPHFNGADSDESQSCVA